MNNKPTEEHNYITHISDPTSTCLECGKVHTPPQPKPDTEPKEYPKGSWAEGYTQGLEDASKNQDTYTLTETQLRQIAKFMVEEFMNSPIERWKND